MDPNSNGHTGTPADRDESTGLGAASDQADGGGNASGAPVGDPPKSPEESSTIGDAEANDTPGEQDKD